MNLKRTQKFTYNPGGRVIKNRVGLFYVSESAPFKTLRLQTPSVSILFTNWGWPPSLRACHKMYFLRLHFKLKRIYRLLFQIAEIILKIKIHSLKGNK